MKEADAKYVTLQRDELQFVREKYPQEREEQKEILEVLENQRLLIQVLAQLTTSLKRNVAQ